MACFGCVVCLVDDNRYCGAGQFDDLCRLFKAFGSPDHHVGDVEENNYVFLGDIVDRGRHGLEVLCLLLALKIQYRTLICRTECLLILFLQHCECFWFEGITKTAP